MDRLKETDIEVYEYIKEELGRQRDNVELIASENFTSEAVLDAQSSVLTNKYAEGYPSKRWYGGCEHVDSIESLAIERAKKIFKAEHANVQPHSGSQANMAVFYTLMEEGDTYLAMDLACGGHLTHGLAANFSGRFYNVVSYGVSRETEMLDFDEIYDKAKTAKPRMIIAGASAYPRTIDFVKFREIADKVGAKLFVDMAHIAGLVVAGIHPSPVPVSDIVASTTHKTLRGPRSGLILCKEEYARKIDSAVFPGLQGGPLEHVIAAKAVAFKEAMSESFVSYQRQVVENAKVMAEKLAELGYRIVSGGTDNHLLLVDLRPKGVSGKEAALLLDSAGITVNKNLIPFDEASPFVTSGVRIGTPAVTTRGMKAGEMKIIAECIDEVIMNKSDEEKIKKVKARIKELVDSFPLYPGL